MKWLKDLIADAKAILLAPVVNILCGTGAVLVLASFIEYDKASGLALHGKVFWPMVLVGTLFAATGVLLFCLTNRAGLSRITLDYTKGVEIKKGGLVIHIKTGKIEEIVGATRNSAIVLPANTAFVDDCAADRRSALGAFFGAHFPEDIAGLPELFRKTLDAKGVHADDAGQYAPGTTIVLPDRFAKPAAVVVTASTIRTSDVGMVSTPRIICGCIEGILNATSDRRIDTVYAPLLGSGHGGVDRGLALMFMMLALLHFSRVHHHIVRFNIVVHAKDVPLLNESEELKRIIAL